MTSSNSPRFAKRKSLLAMLITLAAILGGSPARSGVTINFDIGEITTAGTLVNPGTFLFISHGNDNVLNSNTWLSGSSFVLGDDILMGAFGIVDGRVASAISNFEIATNQGVYGTTKFTGVFVEGLTSAEIDYATGILVGGQVFAASGGTTYSYGSYRTDAIEGFGSGPTGNMAWIVPSDGATLSLWGASNTNIGGSGLYTGADIAAALSTSTTLSVIPEPSSMSLLAIGLIGSMAVRRKVLANRKKCV